MCIRDSTHTHTHTHTRTHARTHAHTHTRTHTHTHIHTHIHELTHTHSLIITHATNNKTKNYTWKIMKCRSTVQGRSTLQSALTMSTERRRSCPRCAVRELSEPVTRPKVCKQTAAEVPQAQHVTIPCLVVLMTSHGTSRVSTSRFGA